MLRHVLLVILSDGEPRHGYAIMKASRRRTGFNICAGTVYRELQRLKGRGQIQPVDVASASDARRIVYRITTRGREIARSWLGRRPRLARRVGADEIDYRLAAFDAMEPANALTFLEDLNRQLRLSVDILRNDRRHADTDGLAPVLIERQVRHLEADIELVGMLRGRLTAPPTETRSSRE